MTRCYSYVGPSHIREFAKRDPTGVDIHDVEELRKWLVSHDQIADEGVTFVITLDGVLRIAPRRSEHVACASGQPVLSAGEIVFRLGKNSKSTHSQAIVVESITNQSAGYIPQPDSWSAVQNAFSRLGIVLPACWTHAFIFGLCPHCHQVNLIKDQVFECGVCGASLPAELAD